MINKTEIRNLIQEGDTKTAIQAFKKFELSSEMVNTLSMLEAEFYRLNEDILQGVIGSEEKDLRINRINKKVLLLLDTPTEKIHKEKSNRKILPIALFFISILIIIAYFVLPINTKKEICPIFEDTSVNKILLIPFINIGEDIAKPHLVLRDRIEALTIKKQLSTNIELTESIEDLSPKDAPEVAKSCGANAIIWGQYSQVDGSVRLILHYHFLERPDLSNLGGFIELNDFTEIQKGEMTKNLEDAIMSLCTVIAVRQNEQETAKKWLAKVEEKETVDLKIAAVLEK